MAIFCRLRSRPGERTQVQQVQQVQQNPDCLYLYS